MGDIILYYVTHSGFKNYDKLVFYNNISPSGFKYKHTF